MNREKGNILLLMILAILVLGSLGAYFYLQRSEESGQLKKAVKFAAKEEAESLILLDKAAHNWMGTPVDSSSGMKNYERIDESDIRYEIPIDELIDYGLLPGGFAERFVSTGESVYGLPYTTSVIRREVGRGEYRTCVKPNDPIGDCESNTGGECSYLDYHYSRCRIQEFDTKYSVLTTIGTKGIPIPERPQIVCPFFSQYQYGSTHLLAENAPGETELQLEGSCNDVFGGNASTAMTFLINRVNSQKTVVLKHSNGATQTAITLLGPPNNDSLVCEQINSPGQSANYAAVEARIAPKVMDSFIQCVVSRNPTVPPTTCNVNLTYCSNNTNVSIPNPVQQINGQCTFSRANNIQISLNTNGLPPYSNTGVYPKDQDWSCSRLNDYFIRCSTSYNCGTAPVTCPAFLNYNRTTNPIVKELFTTYPGACSTYVTTAESEVKTNYYPSLLWETGPSCGATAAGEIICSGGESDPTNPPGPSDYCEVYKQDASGTWYQVTYPGTNCYGNMP